MERADRVAMMNTLREAFLAADREVNERRTVAGHAFLMGGRAVGQFEARANMLRARLWLADKERAVFEARPTFDRDSGWLHLVSDDDVRFVCSLVPAAFKAASSGRAAPPSARTVEMPTTTRDLAGASERKRGAPRRPSARPTR